MNQQLHVSWLWLLCASLVILLGLGACCTKKECYWPETNKIELFNFSDNEIDSISIESFPAGSGFGSRIDSSFTEAIIVANAPPATVFMPRPFNADFDYRVTLLSTGQAYAITDIETIKKTCNTCFPYTPESEYHHLIISCLVNGQRQALDNSLNITK